MRNGERLAFEHRLSLQLFSALDTPRELLLSILEGLWLLRDLLNDRPKGCMRRLTVVHRAYTQLGYDLLDSKANISFRLTHFEVVS